MSRRLLLVSYYFPPVGGAGTQRASKFAKYLPEHGWDVTVLTQGDRDQTEHTPRDDSLMHDASAVPVIKLPASATSRFSPVVDAYQPWADAVIDWIVKETESQPFDAILFTGSPFSLAHAAIELRSRIKTPVLFDFRDPWTFDGWPAYRWVGRHRRERRLLEQLLSRVSGYIANTPEAGRVMASLNPTDPPPSITIPNGFDQDDFEGVPRPERTDAQFRIVHCGWLHSGELYPKRGLKPTLGRLLRYRAEPIVPSGRTLVHLLNAVRRLSDDPTQDGPPITVRHVGNIDEPTKRCISETGTTELVDLVGYLPHSDAVQEICAADLLFLPLHDLPSGQRARIVPGKAYEYFVTGRPILASVPDGDLRDIASTMPGTWLSRPTDERELARVIQQIRSQHTTLPRQIERPEASRFERRVLAKTLAGFLDQLLQGGTRATPENRNQDLHVLSV